MRNKILFALSLVGLIVSTAFVIVSVWNTEWALLEQGYYTFASLTVAVVTYLAIQSVLNLCYGRGIDKLNTFIACVFALVAIAFTLISIQNTEWRPLEKGYYWMGTLFIAITSAMVSSTIRTVLNSDIDYDDGR